MEVSLKIQDLKRWLSLFDKITGTIEPETRRVELFYKNGLWFKASDNCAVLRIFVGESPPFEGARTISLDLLKAFTSDVKGDELRLSIQENLVVLKAGNELLSTKTSKISVEEREENEEYVCTVVKKDFENALNFASSNLEEGAFTGIIFEDEMVTMYGAYEEILTISFLSTNLFKAFAKKIPYATARHVYKFLERLNVQTIDVYTKGELLSLRYPFLELDVCGDALEETEREQLSRLLQEKPLEVLHAKKEIVSRLIRKAAYLGKNTKATLVRDGETMKITFRGPHVLYSAEFFVRAGKDFQVIFSPKRLRGALSRMKGENLVFELTSSHLRIANPSKTQMILLKID